MNGTAKRDHAIPSRLTSLEKYDSLFANDAAVEPRCCWGIEPNSQLQAIAGPVSMEYNIPHHIHRYDPALRWAGPERMCIEMLNQQIGTLTQCCLVGDVNLAKRQLPGANLADIG